MEGVIQLKFRALLFIVLLILESPLARLAIAQDCSPAQVPGKHGTLNIYRVPFNGDGHGHGISHSIWVNFRMFDDGRIEAPLKYDNDSKEAFCGGVHIRLGDLNNNSIAEFYSDPNQCVDGRPLISLGGGPVEKNVNWNLQTTREVACKYAHLYIVPNTNHPATPGTSPQNPPADSRHGTLITFQSCGYQAVGLNVACTNTATRRSNAKILGTSDTSTTACVSLLYQACSAIGYSCRNEGDSLRIYGSNIKVTALGPVFTARDFYP